MGSQAGTLEAVVLDVLRCDDIDLSRPLSRDTADMLEKAAYALAQLCGNDCVQVSVLFSLALPRWGQYKSNNKTLMIGHLCGCVCVVKLKHIELCDCEGRIC